MRFSELSPQLSPRTSFPPPFRENESRNDSPRCKTPSRFNQSEDARFDGLETHEGYDHAHTVASLFHPPRPHLIGGIFSEIRSSVSQSTLTGASIRLRLAFLGTLKTSCNKQEGPLALSAESQFLEETRRNGKCSNVSFTKDS